MILNNIYMLKWFRGTGNKKYKVEIYEKGIKIKTVQFGAKGYNQYKDKTPLKLYSKLDTLDKERKRLYYIRHKKTYPKYSADWFSKKYLW